VRPVRHERCIYCRETLGSRSREHVLPQALGKFRRNLVLECVCHECNKCFAEHLERPFLRNSGEGFARAYHGLRTEQSLRATETIARLYVPGPWFGARVRLHLNRAGRGSLRFQLLPQVAVKVEGAWVWYLEQGLDASLAAQILLETRNPEIKVVAHVHEVRTRLESKLDALGLKGETTYFEERDIGDERLPCP